MRNAIRTCFILGVMLQHPIPILREIESVVLIGTMAIYKSQAEASERIPQQWTEFLIRHPVLSTSHNLNGASPCTGDRQIHYLTGIAEEDWDGPSEGEPLTLEAGEYAVVQVDDVALLRDTWTWLLGSWLPKSGRREKKSPEFERYAGITETGLPVGPVEIWIPLEPLG